jgi:hypothetical protein
MSCLVASRGDCGFRGATKRKRGDAARGCSIGRGRAAGGGAMGRACRLLLLRCSLAVCERARREEGNRNEEGREEKKKKRKEKKRKKRKKGKIWKKIKLENF